MSMANVRAGQAFIELTTRDGKLRKGLQNVEARLRKFGTSLQSVGREYLTFSVGAAAPFAVAVNTFKNFDTQMRVVKAVTGATGKEFDKLTAKAKKVGEETNYTEIETAQAMTSLGRAGFSPDEIINAIGPVMDLARATDTDLANAADIAANSLRIFQKDASESGKVADILTVAANGSAQTVTDLFEALKVAGPQAHSAGESIEDTAAALGVMANMGIKGSLAGTSLRKAFLQFADPKIQKFLEEYGVKTVDTNGNLRKMRDIMVDLTKVMGNMGTAERLSFAKEVFDLRGMTGGLAITADTKKLDEFLKKLQNVEGVAKKTREDIENGTGGAFTRFTSAREGLGMTIGEIVSDGGLTSLLDSLTGVIKAVGNWAKENRSLVVTLAAAVGGIGAIGAALVAAGAVAKVFAGAMALASGGLGVFGLALKGMLALSPAGWFIIAATAATALAAALSGFGKSVEQTSSKMKELADANREKRMQDLDSVKRLSELRSKQHLSNSEMEEAASLVETLETRYGKMGATFDTAAGKVGIMADQLERLNKEIAKKEIADLDKQIAEHEKNIKTAQQYKKDWQFKFSWNPLDMLDTGLGYIDGRKSAADNTNDGYIAEQEYMLASARQRRKLALSGKMGATGSGAGTGKNGSPARRGSIRQALENKKLTTASLLDIAGIRQAFARDKDELARDRQKKAIEAEISGELKNDLASGLKVLAGVIEKLETAAKAAETEFNAAVSRAETVDPDGVVRLTDSEKAQIEKAQKEYFERQSMLDHYRGRLSAAGESIESRQQALGSYSWRDLRGRMGSATAAERTATAAEKQNKLTESTNKKLDELLGASGISYL